MDFTLSEEQQLLQQAAQRFLEREYSPAQRRALAASERGFSEASWQLMCELGWLGLGRSVLDLMVLCETLGQGGVLEPLLPAHLAGRILAQCDSDLARTSLSRLVRGEQKVATALYEPGHRFSLDCAATRAANTQAGYTLRGHKTAVLYAQASAELLVAARIGEGPDQVMGLFLLDTAAPGVSIHPYRMMDGQQAAEVILEDVRLGPEALLVSGEAASRALRSALDSVLIGLCAEALGAMEAAFTMTLDYCRQRRQFGQPIGKFQVLQHRLADLYIQCQGLRSLLYAAATRYAEGTSDAHALVAALKARVAEAGRRLAEEAVQLHGGIGFTEELPLAPLYKRLVCIATLFGDGDHHLRAYLAARRGT